MLYKGVVKTILSCIHSEKGPVVLNTDGRDIKDHVCRSLGILRGLPIQRGSSRKPMAEAVKLR